MNVAEALCSPRVLEVLISKVHQHLGADFSGERSADLLRRFKLLAAEQAVTDLPVWLEAQAFADWDAALIQALTPAFTVGETYFRRDAEALDWLANNYFPPLLKHRRLAGQRHLRIWSAACCTGEEAYSLLFLLDQLLGAERPSWSLTVLASDLNSDSLARAKQADYGQNAFRSNEEVFRQHYFQAKGRLWQVRPQWRERIHFFQHNLATGPLPDPARGLSEVDLILCRNVLMYFSPERAAVTLRRLLSCLTRDGLLLLSAVEAGIATQAGLSGFWAGCNYALSASSHLPAPRPANLPSTAPPLLGSQLRKQVPASATAAVDHAPSPAAQAPVTSNCMAAESPLSAEPVHAQLWQLARQAQAGGQHAQAQQALLEYLACAGLGQAQKHHACLLMARSWADQQRSAEAEDWLQRALLLEPNSASAYWLMALLAQQNGIPKAALVALQKSLYLKPDFILAHFHQARLLRTEGRLSASNKALQICRQLLQQHPQEALLPEGDGLSCGQLLRLCEQLIEDHAACPSQ
ncbi:MAG: CheR family methyltransferase [Pseudomonas sp.]|uniref:CheR family methyltransferase n=1 Tax=Pseudomonas sp. TaxID=306 RepID=UPI0027363E20|nr:CheR family methyltransferase [Pseudomonas sp.]MDP3848332.1 CheR family methyltransferase [Pseudomonas sp.]